MRMLDISLASQSQTGLQGGDGGLGGTTVTGGLVSHRGHHTWQGDNGVISITKSKLETLGGHFYGEIDHFPQKR